jgi:peptidoglycan-N-acetylglucosamine deacetylase
LDKPFPIKRGRFSLAEKTGIGAFCCALLLWPLNVQLSVLPLVAFLVLCLVAPFFPGFGFFLPIVSKGRRDKAAVALTFDDGPDPRTTPWLLDLLDRHHARAAFFVTGSKARRHPQLIREILARGHAIGNHSYDHDNFLMCKSQTVLVRQIAIAQQIFRTFAIVPLAFRPPVGITNPRLPKALDGTELFVVNFNRRARDFGNRRIRYLAARILKRLRPGDIIMLHDVSPPDPNRMEDWQGQIDQVLAGIHERGLAILPLESLIGRPVMKIL